jgi:hypothetical protein
VTNLQVAKTLPLQHQQTSELRSAVGAVRLKTLFKGMNIMKFNKTLAIVAASLALASPFAAQAQSDQQYDAMFNKQVYMQLANKDGMLAKADVMKMVEMKFDKMAKNGMISTDDMGKLLADLHRGR